MVQMVLVILACIAFGLAALEVVIPRVNLTALGLLLVTIAFFFVK